MNFKKVAIISLIILLAAFLRVFQLEKIPSGFYVDEASLGYNAYSIALTGKDEYGKVFPVFIRSLGTYASPLYVYISTIPISLFGLSIFSTRLLSAVSGVLIVIGTFLILLKKRSSSFQTATTASLILAIIPWAIFFSRGAFEANLGLLILITAILLLIWSLEKNWWFIPGSITLAIATYAYHAERIVSVLLLFLFIAIFYKQFRKNEKILLVGILIFFLLQIPQLLLLNSKGTRIRFTEQNYFHQIIEQNSSENITQVVFNGGVGIVYKFASQYSAYFSPRNLFFDPDPDKQRSMPNLSVFYFWLIIPFLIGLREILLQRKDSVMKMVLIILLMSPVPAALTKDPFSTLRALPLFWSLTIIITLGIVNIFNWIKNRLLKITTGVILVLISITSLFSSYFILFRYERAKDWAYGYGELSQRVEDMSNQKFLIDTGRALPGYILFAFYNHYNPVKLQSVHGNEILRDYYNAVQFNPEIKLDPNITIRPIIWEEDIYKNQILVGDKIAISAEQATEHKLTLLFEIKDPTGETLFRGFLTNPKEKCDSERFSGKQSRFCTKYLN